MTTDPAGESIAFGKYELLEKIGTGGMAEIYRARVAGPDGFEKILVVKKILPAYAQNRAFIKMLIAEAKVSSVLQHANIVQIFELGEIDGQYYIAMEYVRGADLLRTLTECTRRNQRMPQELVLFIVAEVCKGLAYAHSATDGRGRPLRIIHRDVSPSNVLLSLQGDVKVMDFGVARADLERASERAHKTASGVLKGKLGYMSPEQVIGAEIDHRSDIFALGIILFEALTLKRLFLGKTDLETLINIRDVKVARKLRKHSYIPKGVQELLMRALARDPHDRFQTATDFQEAILDYLFEHRLRVSNRSLANFMRSIFDPGGATPRRPAALAVDDGDDAAAPRAGVADEPSEATRHLGPGARAAAVADVAASEAEEAARLAAQLLPSRPAPAPAHEAGAAVGSRVDQSALTRAIFRLKADDGATFGPITFTNLVNLLKNRSISARELVRVDDGDWMPVAALPALRQLQPGLFEDEQEVPLYEGPISHLMTPRLLYRLSIARMAGKLKLTRGGLLKEVYLANGVPVHISSNLKEELLGAFMLDRSMIRGEELHQAVDSVREHGGRLGDALVRLGLTRPHDLFRILELQFRQKFLQVFRWRRGWYQFYEGYQPPDDMVWMGNDTVQLLTVGVRTQYDLATMREMFADYLDQVIQIQHNPHITHNNLRFNSRELRFYTYLEDGMSLREAIERYGRTEQDCLTLLQVVFVLHQTDLLALRTPTASRSAAP